MDWLFNYLLNYNCDGNAMPIPGVLHIHNIENLNKSIIPGSLHWLLQWLTHNCDRAWKIWPSKCKKSLIFWSLLYHNLITIYIYYQHKIFITTGEFKELSSATYRNGILHSEWKISNVNQCNLHSYGQFLQAQSQLLKPQPNIWSALYMCFT